MNTIVKWVGDFGFSQTTFLLVIFLGVLLGISFIIPGVIWGTLTWILATAPLWAPPALAFWAWDVWIKYRRADFIASQDMVLLEIRIPRDIQKSPRAMELVFSGLHIGMGETTFINRWWEGKVRPWYSFEIASFGGEIRFYVWTRRFLKDIVEAQIYAQYPEVEIYEAEDYALAFHYDHHRYNLSGCDWHLNKADVLPIKTYVDYELDKDPKEEFKVDPIAHMFEFLGALKPGEQVWIQIMIRTNKEKTKYHDPVSHKTEWLTWREIAKKEIAAIKAAATQKYIDENGKERQGFPNPTPGDVERIKAIEKSVGKQAFDVGMRTLYVAEKEAYRGITFAGLTGIYRQFGSENLNSLVPTGGMLDFSYPWQKWGNAEEHVKHHLLDAYKRRSSFHPPHEHPPFVMVTEELATIYRFPSSIVKSPGLRRSPSMKAEPPPNLPM